MNAIIFRLNRESLLFHEYDALLEKEWGNKERSDAFRDVPKPIALVIDNDLIGGLAFTRFKSPENNETALWVNTVLVKPGYRGHGYASRLINEAVSAAGEFGASSLFVYTEIPRLYTNLGWVVLSNDGAFSVLKTKLST